MKRLALLLLIAAAPVPDDTLTPGGVRTGGRDDVRPPVTESLKAEVRAKYKMRPGEEPAEWDHRVPWGCLGATDASNLWPQDGSKVKKDRLEHLYEGWVRAGRITVEDCQEAFRAPNDWRARYRNAYGREP